MLKNTKEIFYLAFIRNDKFRVTGDTSEKTAYIHVVSIKLHVASVRNTSLWHMIFFKICASINSHGGLTCGTPTEFLCKK